MAEATLEHHLATDRWSQPAHKIMRIALATIVLFGLGLTWQVRLMVARALTRELEQRGALITRNLSACNRFR